MMKSIDEVAVGLIDLSTRKAIELGKTELLSQTRVVMGACIGPAEVRMVLSAALAYAVVYAASYEYEAVHGRTVNDALMRHLYASIEKAGDDRFSARFRSVWNSLRKDLNAQEALRRIGYMLRGDASQLLTMVVKSCFDWALLKLQGTGYMPEYTQERHGAYDAMVETCNRFVLSASGEINFDECIFDGGFKSIDLDKIPPCDDEYDVFISYRRSDGDVYARLLRQELAHRGFDCFLDVESVVNGEYDLQILAALKKAPCFLFIKSQESLKGVEDPDDHVRIELEAAGHYKKDLVIVAPSGVPRDMSQIALPHELEYLKNYRVYKLDVGESYEFGLDQILKCVQHRAGN